MGEVLSQSEIDNLLAALSTGELDANDIPDASEKQVKQYDFKRPAKFSKEHLRTLEIMFENYGRLLTTHLPVYLRRSVQVSVTSSESVTFSEFMNALSNPVILGIVNFNPLPGSAIIEMATQLGFAMIDRMLGGQGVPLDKKREFSEIELTILDKIMVIFMQMLREPWKNVVDLHPTLERIETNAQFVQIISPSDMIAIVTMNVKIGDVEGLVNICLPFATLEDVMDKLNTKFRYSTIQDDKGEDYELQIETLIRKVDVPVKAILGHSKISVSDFMNLQVGDIIRLDRRVEEDMEVYVGNIKKFRALPGTSKENNAVRITTVLREEE